MKYSSKISMVSVLCALCVCTAGSASGASSVRALGGTGTISGTSAAASGSATSVARAGSVRVAPTNTKATTGTSAAVSTNNTSAARGATTSRLSIGKFLSGGIKTDGSKLKPNVSISSAGNTVSAEVMQIVEGLQGDVKDLHGEIAGLQGDIDGLLADRHSALGAKDGGFIEIDGNNELFIKVDDLADALSDKLGVDAGTIDIALTGSDDNKYISFCQSNPDSECKYQEIIAVSELRGEKGDKGDSVSVDELNTMITSAVEKLEFGSLAWMNTVGTDQIDNGAVNEDKLSDELKAMIGNGEGPDLSNYVTNDVLTSALDGKQDTLTDEQMVVLDSGITKEGVAQIGVNAANITANADAIDANKTAISEKANAADVYTKSETYDRETINGMVKNVTAGNITPAPDDNDYAWVSLGGEQQWVSIAGAVKGNE